MQLYIRYFILKGTTLNSNINKRIIYDIFQCFKIMFFSLSTATEKKFKDYYLNFQFAFQLFYPYTQVRFIIICTCLQNTRPFACIRAPISNNEDKYNRQLLSNVKNKFSILYLTLLLANREV